MMATSVLFLMTNNTGIASNTVFIIDTYNPFSPYNDNVRSIFWLHGQSWAIKEVACEWGKPIIPTLVGEEVRPENFYLYNTLEEAKAYIHTIQRLNT